MELAWETHRNVADDDAVFVSRLIGHVVVQAHSTRRKSRYDVTPIRRGRKRRGLA